MTRKECLQVAERCVCGERDRQHGAPEDTFGLIAELWSGYLEMPLTPKDVAAMMILMKVSRIAKGNPHSDNWVDIAGYAACGAELEVL